MTNRHGLIAGAADVDGAAEPSPLYARYGTRSDTQSAREMLAARLEKPAPPAAPPRVEERHREAAKAAASGSEFVRGLFGMLKKGL